MMGIGAFTPLDGFMGEADWRGCCEQMRLGNGLFWPIPITRTGLIRSPLLEHNDHRFWFYPITFSGFPESVIGIQYG